jgi:UDP-N-acetylglucosamine 4,6-dehydratase
MALFDNKSILITGGTGSFGRHFANYLLKNFTPRRLAIFSRDELKQSDLRNKFEYKESLRWFLGDIRDKDRLKLALKDVDFVIHAAALKQVDTGEYNPMEFIKTNILGSQNLIEAALENGVEKVVALSTDKASSPINLYGATKLTADKLFIAANNYSNSRGCIFSVVRYGNVIGSRGSVVPFFMKLAEVNRPLPITDLRMTRFWITLEQASNFVVDCFSSMQGGELFVPRIPSLKIMDLVTAINSSSEIEIIGMRPGEKLHEEMISQDDSWRTTKLNDRYIVAPVFAEWGYKGKIGEKVPEFFTYRSDNNDLWLNVEEIKKMISNSSFNLD